jgi:hypothetical protein
MNNFQIRIDEPIHWWIAVLAIIGLVSSLLLVYRRFYPMKPNVVSVSTNVFNGNKLKTLRFSLVTVANIMACFSMVLFILPIESKIKNTAFDILFTTGADYSLNDNEFNIKDVNNKPLHEELKAARYVWLIKDDSQEIYRDEFIDHLISHYKNKVRVIKSAQELNRLWRQKKVTDKAHELLFSSPPKVLKVIGDGLNKQQWQQLDPSSINGLALAFLPSAKLLGLTELNWARELYLGQIMRLVGKLQKPLIDKGRYQLSLFYNKQLIASTLVADDGSFSLETSAKIPGLFKYQLVLNKQGIESSSDNTTEKASGISLNEMMLSNAELIEDIAFSVIGSSKPSVIIKQSSPSFETRQLKHWLSRASSPVKVITKISKNKWSQQRINIAESDKLVSKPLTSHQLTTSLLNDADLLILDSRALVNLALAELSALELAVEKGLGLYINIDESILQTSKLLEEKSHLLAGFSFQPVALNNNKVIPLWPGQSGFDAENPVMARAVAVNIAAEHAQMLVESTDGRQLVVSQPFGLGNIVISTLTQTYPWALEAGEVFYSQYWQTLLSKVTRVNSTRWLAATPDNLTLIKQLTKVCLVSSNKRIYSPEINLSDFPLSNYKKCGLVISNEAGWVKLQALDENKVRLAEQARYIYPQSSFKAWQQADMHKLSANNSVESSFSTHKVAVAEQYQTINKHYLWLIFLLSITFLWLERKWLTG